MIDRGDFAGTTYIEFQQNGEPTLHPHFNDLVEMISSVVPYLGMSTNASFMKWKHEPIIGVRNLDCLTISIHDETTTADILDVLRALEGSKTKVRLQTLNKDRRNVDVGLIVSEFPATYIDDYEIREWQHDYGKKKFCIDVKTSVTVQYDGDVVPCCNVVGKQKVLGSLRRDSLADIWESCTKEMFPYCDTCRTPSPYTNRLVFFTSTMSS
jgi:MoaA/NifB/PqqE/SkfB family radical SAM enzyme